MPTTTRSWQGPGARSGTAIRDRWGSHAPAPPSARPSSRSSPQRRSAVSEILTAGITGGGDTLIVLRAPGRLLGTFAADEVGDERLARCWAALERLAHARVAHREISPWAIRIEDGEVTLVDLGGGIVAPDHDERLTDRAQLLATTASVVGSDRAIAAAVAAIGTEELSALLPYLQQAAFAGPLRKALKTAGVDVDDLRKDAAEAAAPRCPTSSACRA